MKQKVIDPEPLGAYNPRKTESASYHKEEIVVQNADILVVDDNDMNLKVAKGILKIYGVVPELADSGKTALDMVRIKRYDLIFLDHMMPGMDGIETLQAMKKEDLVYDTPVICLTANAIAGVREQYIKEGFTDYLSKPIEVGALEGLLVKYLPKDKIAKKAEDDVLPVDKPEQSEENASPMEKLAVRGFDTAAGVEYSAGMEEFYLEMVKTFADGYEEKAAEIAGDFSKENLENYRTRVHALKSTAKMIGAMELSELALGQENAAKDGDLEAVKAGHDNLMKLYDKTVVLIKESLL